MNFFLFEGFYFPKDLKISLSKVAEVDLYLRLQGKLSVNGESTKIAIPLSNLKKLKV